LTSFLQETKHIAYSIAFFKHFMYIFLVKLLTFTEEIYYIIDNQLIIKYGLFYFKDI